MLLGDAIGESVKAFILWSRDHPRLVISLLALMTLFFAFHAPNVRFDASTQAMTIATDPARVVYNKVTERFGSDNITIVYIKDPDILTHRVLTAVEDIFYTLEELPRVARVDGLFNATNFKGENGELTAAPLLDWVPEDPDELARVKEDALRNPLLNRHFIAPEESAIALMITADPDPNEKDFDLRLADDIDRVIAPLQGRVQQIFQVGVPQTRRSLNQTVIQDLVWIGPLFYLLLFVVLVLGIRTVNGVVLPLMTSGLSIVWTLGFMALADIPLNMITWVVPSLIFILGATEDMHLIAEYQQGLAKGYDRLQAIEHMAEEGGLAVLLTGLTTFLGFLTVVVNDITILKQFGSAAAFGLFVNPLITASLIPVYLRLVGRRGTREPVVLDVVDPPTPRIALMDRVADGFVHAVIHHPKVILAVAIVGLPIAILGAFNLKVDNDLISNFRPHTEIRRHSQQLHQELAGMQNFYIVLDAQREQGFKTAKPIQQLFDIQRAIASLKVFDTSVALSDHVALIHREMADGDPMQYRIPEQDELIAQYLLFFTRSDLERYISPDFRQANIHVRHNLSSSHELQQALKSLQAKMDTIVEAPLTYTITSESILFNNAADSMAKGQVYSLSLILISIFIVLAFLFFG